MKWVALGMIVVALMLAWVAYRIDPKASYESGRFLVEILLLMVAVGLGVGGALWLLVLLFMHM